MSRQGCGANRLGKDRNDEINSASLHRVSFGIARQRRDGQLPGVWRRMRLVLG